MPPPQKNWSKLPQKTDSKEHLNPAAAYLCQTTLTLQGPLELHRDNLKSKSLGVEEEIINMKKPDKTKEAGTYYTISDTSTFVLWLLQHHLLCHTSFIHSSPIKVSWSTKHFRIFTAKTAAEFSSTTEELMVCYSPSLRDPKIHLKRYHVHPRWTWTSHMGSQFGITLTELYGAIYDV